MMQLDLFTLPDCLCGWAPEITEYPEEVRIGGWCMCNLAVAPIAIGRTVEEAKEDWMRVLVSGSAT